MTAKASEEE